MPQEFRKTLKLKWGDIRTRVRRNLTAMIWKDKRHVNMLTNMHHSPASFFHILDLTVLNSYILLTSGRAKLSYRELRLYLIRDLRRVEGYLDPRECQPFPPASWRLDTVCTGQTEGLCTGIVCVPQKRGIIGQ
jgi:hypothetical protein